jgi:hypothetical protein
MNYPIIQIIRLPNQRASLDAAVAFCLHFGGHWRRASEPERSVGRDVKS